MRIFTAALILVGLSLGSVAANDYVATIDGVDLLVNDGMSSERSQKIIAAVAPLQRTLAQTVDTLERMRDEAWYEEEVYGVLSPSQQRLVKAFGQHLGPLTFDHIDAAYNLYVDFLEKLMDARELHILEGGKDQCGKNIAAFVWMARDPASGALKRINMHTRAEAEASEVILYLCHLWFEMPDVKDKIATLAHELAHWLLGAEDHAYVHEQNYPNLTPAQRLQNADSIAAFIQAVYENT